MSVLYHEIAQRYIDEDELTAYRREDVGFVFQFYNLMPNLTALENVELAEQICKAPWTLWLSLNRSD